jgi:glycosyltransferase involved in cell wall biosynthesis
MPPKVIIGLQTWYLGGPTVFAERLARGLTGRGWDARILINETSTIRITEQLTPRAIPDDIILDFLPAGYYDEWGERWEALVRYLEQQAPCIYIINGDWRHSVVAPRLSDRVRIIGVVHADYELEYDQIDRLGLFMNAIVAVSDVIQFNVAHHFSHLASRTVTIRNAVVAPAQMPAKPVEGPLHIAYCGELRRGQKRLPDMVRVAHGLAARNIPFVLTFIGDGPIRAELEEQAGSLVEQGQVRFPGRLDGAALIAALAPQHAFILTSEFEGLSIALLEAMSYGCVPVLSDLVTQSMVVRDGFNGYTVPVGDIATFVGRLSTLAGDPALRQRMAQAAFQTIQTEGYRVEDMLDSYIALFDRIDRMVEEKRFVRPRGWMYSPPASVGNIAVLPANTLPDLIYVNELPLWPNALSAPAIESRPLAASPPAKLEDYRVIFAIPGGQISGVDVFSCHLVRQLRLRGIDAKVVGARVLEETMGLPLADDVPVESLPVPRKASWLRRWDAMIAYLEGQAPCIYVPNYDYECSAISPVLSDGVKVVSIAHSDDPAHYEHVLRLGRASNAVVGVSTTIVRHLAGLDLSLASRLHTIPYGVELPPVPPERDATRAPLRIVFAGRMKRYQKRVEDVVRIAELLDKRQVPFELAVIGDGPERHRLEEMGKKLIVKRCLWFPGKLANEDVLDILCRSDVFLLPSAFEGLPVSLLEAMSRGVVPVVSNIRSGIPELIRNGENGLIAPIGDIERFTDHLCDLYHHPERRLKLSQAAYETICAGGYRLEDMTGRYLEMFNTVITQSFARPPGSIQPPEYLRSELHWKLTAKHTARKRLRALRDALRKPGKG